MSNKKLKIRNRNLNLKRHKPKNKYHRYIKQNKNGKMSAKNYFKQMNNKNKVFKKRLAYSQQTYKLRNLMLNNLNNNVAKLMTKKINQCEYNHSVNNSIKI